MTTIRFPTVLPDSTPLAGAFISIDLRTGSERPGHATGREIASRSRHQVPRDGTVLAVSTLTPTSQIDEGGTHYRASIEATDHEWHFLVPDSGTFDVGDPTIQASPLEPSILVPGPQGPQGEKGDPGTPGTPGATGPGATIEVGATMQAPVGGTPSVVNVGTETDAVFDFTLPPSLDPLDVPVDAVDGISSFARVVDLGFNPRNYGALCDGTTDDTGALQATLSAAQSAGGGTVVIPGPIAISDVVDVPNRVNLVGVQGGGFGGGNGALSRIVCLAANAQIRFGVVGSNPRGGRSGDFTIWGQDVGGANPNGGGLLYLAHGTLRLWDNIAVYDSAGDGIVVEKVQNATMRALGTFGAVGYGIRLDRGAANNTFVGCTTREIGKAHIYLGTQDGGSGTYGTYTFGNVFVGGIHEEVHAAGATTFRGNVVQEGSLAYNVLHGVTLVNGQVPGTRAANVCAESGRLVLLGGCSLNAPTGGSGIYVGPSGAVDVSSTLVKQGNGVVVDDGGSLTIGTGFSAPQATAVVSFVGSTANAETRAETMHRHLIPSAQPRWVRYWVAGEAQPRLALTKVATGIRLDLGDGSLASDTNLYRSGADRLRTDDLLSAGLGVQTRTKEGAPVDADWTAAPPDGTIVVDTTGSRLYVRIGGTWKSVALA